MLTIFERLDPTVRGLQEALQALKVKEPILQNALIETWRHDEPTVTISWIDTGGINKNISASIEEHSVHIEANAWNDDEGRRCYAHLEVAQISMQNANLQEVFAEAYRNVSRIKKVGTGLLAGRGK